jgi:precorrin-6B methylase 2
MGLFSSNDVDSGTRLLLKTLAKETDLSSFHDIADIGCGVGTIGIALKAHLPEARIIMRDRDSLACDYSRWNSELNGIRPDQIEQELMMHGLEEKSLDLLVTNIPAKAGDRVLEDFFERSANYLKENGTAALVIVSPLREEAEALMADHDIEILYREHTKMHSVYHFRRSDSRGEDRGLETYIRHRADYSLEGRGYTLDTVYNVPDFDMIGWRHQLAARVLKPHAKSGTWCFWNPGQGHIPVFFHKKCLPGADRIILSGRDLLQCRITAHNLAKEGFAGDCLIESLSLFPSLIPLAGENSLDLLAVDMNDTIPRTDWYTPLKESGRTLLKKGGLLVLYGKSSDIQQFMKGGNRGYMPCGDERARGNRCVILRRN